MTTALRYVKKAGYYQMFYENGQPHYWDVDDFIWDSHLECFVDENGRLIPDVKPKAPVRVGVYDMNNVKPKLQHQIDRLNREAKMFDEEVKSYIHDISNKE